MTSFAYQGFGFGEFFKSQQKLQEILEACFHGVFDAPSGFLSLARTLERLADNIERLFDENSNPNSALLRPSNKPQAQQMLRIASHGLIDSLKQLEQAIPIQTASREPVEMRGFNIVMHLELSGDEHLLEVLRERFAFHSWKLDLFFKALRANKITNTLQVYDGVQNRIGSFFQELAARKSTASNETMSSTGGSEISGVQDVDVIQKFQDSCEFGSGGNQFVWKLKPESTLLITLHWVFHLSKHNDPKNLPVEAYVNLMKCSWLLRVTTPDAGVEGFSNEMRTMIGLLGCDVVYQLQEYFEKDIDPPLPSELLDRGDFSIFIDGINRDLGIGLTQTAVPSAFPGEAVQPPRITPAMNAIARAWVDQSMGLPHDNRISPVDDGPDSARSSMDARPSIDGRISMDIDSRPPARAPPMPPFNGGISAGHSSTPSIGSISSFQGGMNGMPEIYPTSSHLSSRPSTPSGPSTYTPTITSTHSGHVAKKSRPTYSWNEVVDRENLGVRPGETEILARDFEVMHLMASYTGDKHGRWDNCRLRIFKIMADKTLRILTLMEGLEESIDQRVAYVKEADLVPDYGYHQNHPIIYIRKTHKQDPFLHKNPAKITGKPMPPSSLYYKFRSAHGTYTWVVWDIMMECCCSTTRLDLSAQHEDMFNFQFALLGECVEADFQAVRTVRFKKSLRDGEHSHYKARIQLWREPDEDLEVLASTPTVAPEVTRAAWQRANLKVHTTRIVMYWDETITTFFITDSIDIEHRNRRFVVRIRPSSYKAFSNPTSVKARTFGSRDQPGGFRLDKKGLFPDDEDSFEDFRWFEIEFNNQSEMDNFCDEFSRAVNIRRRERFQAEELSRLAARGIQAGQVVSATSLRR